MLKTKQQTIFNEIKGTITELNESDPWCSVTVSVGHNNSRDVNFSCKKGVFDTLIKGKFDIDNKVLIRFYLSSRSAHGRWYTNASILSISRLNGST